MSTRPVLHAGHGAADTSIAKVVPRRLMFMGVMPDHNAWTAAWRRSTLPLQVSAPSEAPQDLSPEVYTLMPGTTEIFVLNYARFGF